MDKRQPYQLARTHCPQGHPYAGENLRVGKNGSRNCKECARDSKRRYGANQRRAKKGLPPLPSPRTRLSDSERFWSHVGNGDGMECWPWQAGVNRDGYGIFRASDRGHLVHRWAYEELRAEIPAGLVIDHLCRNRACVNPWHMEPVLRAVNTRRGLAGKLQLSRTHCPKGHPYDETNTYQRPGGGRGCRECTRARGRAWYRKTKGKAA